MKKLLCFITLIALFTINLTAQGKKSRAEIQVEQSISMPKESQQRSNNQGQNYSQGTRYKIFEANGSVGQGRYFNIQHYKNDMYNGYKYEVEVFVHSGDPDLYIYAEDGGYYREIRRSTNNGSFKEESFYTKSDLFNHENLIYCSIYGKQHSSFKVVIYKVQYQNMCIDPSKINPNAFCTKEFRPVCGCDGKTYSNACIAENAGVTSWTNGACNGGGQHCIDESQKNFTVLCTQQYQPVCGCDGKTYNNECVAKFYGGVTSWTPGPCQGGGHTCNWDFWFEKPQHGYSFHKGSHVYVKLGQVNYQDIEFAELYLNGHFIRKESNYPYEWCRPNDNDDHQLRNLHPGTYKLKCKIKDKCGAYHEKEITFYVNH